MAALKKSALPPGLSRLDKVKQTVAKAEEQIEEIIVSISLFSASHC
jgi:hypothetical protein